MLVFHFGDDFPGRASEIHDFAGSEIFPAFGGSEDVLVEIADTVL